VEEAALGVIGGAVVDFFALAAADDEAAVSQRAQVVGDGGAGHFEHSGDIDDALFAVAEEPEDADSGGVAELFEDFRDGLEVFDMGELFLQLFCFPGFVVAVGQLRIRHMVVSFLDCI